MSVSYQGVAAQTIANRGLAIFLNGMRIVPNDSNDPPTAQVDGNGVTLTTMELRIRSNGTIVVWGGSSWKNASIERYGKYSVVPANGADGVITFTNDDSPNGDGAEGVVFRVNNILLTPPLIIA